jgi:hypothetical protein
MEDGWGGDQQSRAVCWLVTHEQFGKASRGLRSAHEYLPWNIRVYRHTPAGGAILIRSTRESKILEEVLHHSILRSWNIVADNAR